MIAIFLSDSFWFKHSLFKKLTFASRSFGVEFWFKLTTSDLGGAVNFVRRLCQIETASRL